MMIRTLGLGSLLLISIVLLLFFVVWGSREATAPPLPENKVSLIRGEIRREVKLITPDGTSYLWLTQTSLPLNKRSAMTMREAIEALVAMIQDNLEKTLQEDKFTSISGVESLKSQPVPMTTQDKVSLTKAETRVEVKVTLPEGTAYAWSSETSISTNEPVEMAVQELSEEVRSMVQDNLKEALRGVHELLGED